MKNLKNLDWESFDEGVYLPKEKKKNKTQKPVEQDANANKEIKRKK